MPAPRVSVRDMDTGVILYAAELEVPALRQTARQILEAEAKRFGVSLDTGDVLLRRAEGGPELHVVAAAEELLMHLMAGITRSPTTAAFWSWRGLGRRR